MAEELRMALVDVLRKAGVEQADFLREGVRVLAQELMELEVAEQLGAERHERTPERSGYRNGYRERPWDTRVGTIELQVPRVRDGSFFPSLLEQRRRAERALVSVVQEAYVQGISTRRVDDLVQALGMQGISKSQVSRMCAELDKEVESFRTRKLTGPYPYVWLDGTFVKVRDNGRVVSQAIVIDRHRGDGQLRARSARAGCWTQRERRVLAGVPAGSGGARAERRQARHQ